MLNSLIFFLFTFLNLALLSTISPPKCDYYPFPKLLNSKFNESEIRHLDYYPGSEKLIVGGMINGREGVALYEPINNPG